MKRLTLGQALGVWPVPLPEVRTNGAVAHVYTRQGLFIKSYTRTRDYRSSRRTRNIFNPAHHVQCNIFHQI